MSEIIYHHGIKGQKWGIRRYQNSDGSLTPAGKKRYEQIIKTTVAIGGTVAISYAGMKFATDPKIRSIAMKVINKLSNKSISEISNAGSYQVYSKSLGRMLTVEELVSAGLI